MHPPSPFGACFAALLLVSVPRPGLLAQPVETDLGTIGALNAQRYVEPLTRGVGLAMGGGVFNGAHVLDGLGFDVGIRVSMAVPPDEATRFTTVLPPSITWENESFGGTFEDPYRASDGDLLTPTLAGEGPGIVLEPSGEFRSALVESGRDPSEYELRLPSGRNTWIIPHPVVHASLGVGFGTELSLQYLPGLEVDAELGHLHGLGFGVRHLLTRWFTSPIDVSVVAARQELELAEYADATSTQYGVVAGREMGPLSLFATGMVRSGEVKVRYRVDNPGDDNPALPPDGTEIGFTEEVGSRAAFGLGARLQLLILNLAGQYTFDDYPLVTLKIGFGAG